MPYKIQRVKGGFKVAKKDGSKTFSDKPLSYSKAVAQMKALYLSEKKGK